MALCTSNSHHFNRPVTCHNELKSCDKFNFQTVALLGVFSLCVPDMSTDFLSADFLLLRAYFHKINVANESSQVEAIPKVSELEKKK